MRWCCWIVVHDAVVTNMLSYHRNRYVKTCGMIYSQAIRWSKPSKCSKKCGQGKSISYFEITKVANKCGKKCADEGKKKEVPCNNFPKRLDCKHSWSPWSTCPTGCLKDGEAIPSQKRTRTIRRRPSTCPDSVKCPSDMSQDRKCDPPPKKCKPDCKPKDCKWEWSEWGRCSKSCGNGGTRYRQTRVLVPPECGGQVA